MNSSILHDRTLSTQLLNPNGGDPSLSRALLVSPPNGGDRYLGKGESFITKPRALEIEPRDDGKDDNKDDLKSEDIKLDMGEVYVKRDNWVESDNDFLKMKLRKVRGHKILYERVQEHYEYMVWRNKIIKNIFLMLVPLLSAINSIWVFIDVENLNALVLIVSFIGGSMSVIADISSNLTYSKDSSHVHSLLASLEDDINDIMCMPIQLRANPTKTIKTIDDSYDKYRKICEHIPVNKKIKLEYKAYVDSQVELDTSISDEDKPKILEAYYVAIGDAPVC